jgi:hypothetical protein
MRKQGRNGDASLGTNRRRTMTSVEWCQIRGIYLGIYNGMYACSTSHGTYSLTT